MRRPTFRTPLNATIFFGLLFFFFNDTATTEIYTLSLHDALPISPQTGDELRRRYPFLDGSSAERDRKSTRLNSSHVSSSYAVFCLKKKKNYSQWFCVNDQESIAIIFMTIRLYN